MTLENQETDSLQEGTATPASMQIGTAFSECAKVLELLPNVDQRMRVLKALTIVFEE